VRCAHAIAVLVSLGVAAAVLAAAAPGSAQPFPQVDQPGVTDTEIGVGGGVSKTNPLGGAYASAFDGVKAYFNMVNSAKEKGIYGRTLRLTSERDDQGGMGPQEVQ